MVSDRRQVIEIKQTSGFLHISRKNSKRTQRKCREKNRVKVHKEAKAQSELIPHTTI